MRNLQKKYTVTKHTVILIINTIQLLSHKIFALNLVYVFHFHNSTILNEIKGNKCYSKLLIGPPKKRLKTKLTRPANKERKLSLK